MIHAGPHETKLLVQIFASISKRLPVITAILSLFRAVAEALNYSGTIPIEHTPIRFVYPLPLGITLLWRPFP